MSSRFTALAPAITTAQSSVVHAHDAVSGSEVALKRSLPGDDRSLACLLREIEVLGAVQHSHLLKVVATGEDQLGLYLASAWHSGQSVDTWIGNTSAIHAETFRSLFSRLLDAVAAVHDAGFAHGDLTAANVLLTVTPSIQADSLCLIDLGNATPLATNTGQCSDKLRGSIFSMAPELFDGHPASVLSDLYALGILAYYMLTGSLPFQGETKEQVIASHGRHWRKPLQELRPDLPAQLLDWVEWFMARKPADRPASVVAAIAALPTF
jgi:eukaryotic-like serine/threonine-protein kinase